MKDDLADSAHQNIITTAIKQHPFIVEQINKGQYRCIKTSR